MWRCVVDKCGLESVFLYFTLNVDINKTVDWIVSRLENPENLKVLLQRKKLITNSINRDRESAVS